MYRGTTPTITFSIPFDCRSITLLNICFSQQGKVILEKSLDTCTMNGKTIQVSLSEDDTLLFDDQKGSVEMQLRVGCGNTRLVSNIMRVSVQRILKDGCLG